MSSSVIKAAVCRRLVPLTHWKDPPLSCSRAAPPSWFDVCLHVLAVFAGKASAYKTAPSKPPGHPAVTHCTTRLLKQTIKLSCLTTRLSPLYPRCLLNHTASVTHPCISAQMLFEIYEAGIIPKTFAAAVWRMKWGGCFPQINPKTHVRKLFQTTLYALIWVCTWEQDPWRERKKCRPPKVQRRF